MTQAILGATAYTLLREPEHIAMVQDLASDFEFRNESDLYRFVIREKWLAREASKANARDAAESFAHLADLREDDSEENPFTEHDDETPYAEELPEEEAEDEDEFLEELLELPAAEELGEDIEEEDGGMGLTPAQAEALEALAVYAYEADDIALEEGDCSELVARLWPLLVAHLPAQLLAQKSQERYKLFRGARLEDASQDAAYWCQLLSLYIRHRALLE